MHEATRILVLEDVAADVVQMNHELRGAGLKFRCKRVETKEDFLRELQNHPPDVILSNYRLPSFDGFTALALASERRPDTPFIFVTAAVGELMAVEMFKSGATDYVMKERLGDLAPAVRRALREAKGRAKRLEAETERRASDDRFRSILQSLEEFAIFMLDRKGRVTFWNAGAERIKGYSAQEIIGQSFAVFFTPEDVKQDVSGQLLKRAALEGRVACDGQRVRKNRERIRIQGFLTASHDNQGHLRGFSNIAHDITREREAETKIRELNEELERRVAQRTAQLEMANTELEAFSFSISHELRAPLRRISGFVDILQAEAAPRLDEKSLKHLQTISKGAQQMSSLIDALLEFSRMGRSEMRNEKVDIARLIAEARRELQRDANGREIEWTIGELPDVNGDTLMLKQAVINLLSNALKFTRSRKPAKIEIGAKRDGGETIYFIRDNGVGFDMSYAGKLFGVFQRLHPPREFEGSGIGLANVRHILRRHGGRVWAEGIVSQGATFYFSLPEFHAKVTSEDVKMDFVGGR